MKKRTKSISILLLAAIAACQASSRSFADTFYTTTVTNTPGFIADWPFSPSTGANSTGTYTGTFFGSGSIGPTGSGPGIAGDASNTALQMNGSTDYVLTSLQGGISSQGSLLAWVYLNAEPSSLPQYFSIAGESASSNDFDFQIEPDNHVKFYTDTGSNTAYGTPLATGQWYFLAATFIASGERDIYLNGNLVATGTAGGHSANSATFYVGESPVFTGRFFDGREADVAVFNQALTPSQISTIFAAASVPEPSTLLLAGFGLVGLLALTLRRRNRLA